MIASQPQIKYIRKLGMLEQSCRGIDFESRVYVCRSLLISSEIDIYKDIDLVKKAIKKWMCMNTFLRCIVAKRKAADSDKLEEYFALPSDDKMTNFENVKFLYYNSKSRDETFDQIWKLLVEKEKVVPFGDASLLWRLTFLQIKCMPESFKGTFHYILTLTYDHSIMDGKSSYTQLLKLIALVENMKNLNLESEPMETYIPPCKEEVFKNRPPMPEQPAGNCYIKTPEFLDVKNASHSAYVRLENLSLEEEEHGLVYTHENKPFVSVKELIQISKEIYSKFRTFIIAESELGKLLQKCRQNETKLTSLLNMIIILALKRFYLSNGDEQTKHDPITFANIVSLRELEEFKLLKPDTLGYFASIYLNAFRDKNALSGTDWQKELWLLAQQESKSFHILLNNGQFTQPIWLTIPKAENEFWYHFANTNLGVVDSSLTENRLIRVEQTFTSLKYPANQSYWFINMLATVNNQLCWTVHFDSHYIKQEFISIIIQNIRQIIHDINVDWIRSLS